MSYSRVNIKGKRTLLIPLNLLSAKHVAAWGRLVIKLALEAHGNSRDYRKDCSKLVGDAFLNNSYERSFIH